MGLGLPRAARAVAAGLVGTLLLTGCDFDGAYDLPLPGSPVDADEASSAAAVAASGSRRARRSRRRRRCFPTRARRPRGARAGGHHGSRRKKCRASLTARALSTDAMPAAVGT